MEFPGAEPFSIRRCTWQMQVVQRRMLVFGLHSVTLYVSTTAAISRDTKCRCDCRHGELTSWALCIVTLQAWGLGMGRLQ
jgi:hypothetical protein